MQYNFPNFIKSKNINTYSLAEIIDTLNKAGIEVEGSFFEKKEFYLDVKIPANRPDLKIFIYFLKDILFNLNLSQTKQKRNWLFLKNNYFKILKKKIKLQKHKITFEKSNIIDFEKKLNTLQIKWLTKSNKNIFKSSNYLSDIYGDLTFKPTSTHNLILYNFRKLYQNVNLPISLSKKRKSSTSRNILQFNKLFLSKILGEENSKLDVFKALPFALINENKENFYFSIPSIREDLSREIDLIEEYCKKLKYENFKFNYPCLGLTKLNKKRTIIALIKSFFINLNYSEVMTNSLVTGSAFTNVFLVNPLNKEVESLKQSFTFKHLEIFESLKNKEKTKIFEISRLFKKSQGRIKENDFLQCTKIVNSNSENFMPLWIETKNDFDSFFDYFNLSKKINAFVDRNWLSKENCILYQINNKTIARLLAFKNEDSPQKAFIFIFQLHLNNFLEILNQPKTQKIKEISKYPEMQKDLSFTCEKEINLLKLKKEILETYTKVKTISFFDVYLKKEIIKLGIRFKFQSFEKTLTNQEIEKEIQNINQTLYKNYNLNFLP